MHLLSFLACIAMTPASASATESSDFSELVRLVSENFVGSKLEVCEGRPDCACAVFTMNGSVEARFSLLRLCPMEEAAAVLYETFRTDGSPVDVCPTRDKKFHGLCRSFHPNGTLAAEAQYSGGCQDGGETTWHPNGAIASESSYIKGAPDGREVRRDPDGELTAEILWERGRAVRVEQRNEQGELVEFPSGGNASPDWTCLGEVF